jgi:hypothetical protein
VVARATSTWPASFVVSKKSELPQQLQKLRVPSADDA